MALAMAVHCGRRGTAASGTLPAVAVEQTGGRLHSAGRLQGRTPEGQHRCAVKGRSPRTWWRPFTRPAERPRQGIAEGFSRVTAAADLTNRDIATHPDITAANHVSVAREE
jgi:hypothetical protein